LVDRAAPRTFTVAELGQAVHAALAEAFPGEVWVRGEIRGLNRAASGHVYFDLVDPGELGRAVPAKVAVALFDSSRQVVNRILRRSGGAVRMTDGVEVRVRGAVEFHPPTGQLKLVMSLIDPAYTLGRLAADRDQLLRQLAQEGLLERNRRLPLPPAPLRVGLVTSAGSAAASDFLDELARSGFGFRVVAVDTRVQGPGAPEAVVAALAVACRRDVDLVALVRGGGARTELATFDGETVARAIAGSGVPVWTGIGHEIDTAVADHVAHRAWKTPTACAAALVEAVGAYLAGAEQRWAAIASLAAAAVARADSDVDAVARRLGRGTDGALRLAAARLDDVARRTRREADLVLRQATQHLDGRAALCDAFDPARALARGWSITRDGRGRLLRDPAGVSEGEQLVSTLAGGELRSTVTGRG
jgi:exodeoxyribonuclease VII large subunit